ncbi:hypothetical protein HMPREF1316_0039 [Olsenella profusa F0195]|uniref:Uncharacterized protein n=1 Tax=Olsenella profusa F0195 TaxID=1125712 RepID=U2V6X2_9ACTN|nr:hypothetical protein HMPREF1316_0039 [Olsenella profusa F0195]
MPYDAARKANGTRSYIEPSRASCCEDPRVLAICGTSIPCMGQGERGVWS